MKLRRLQLEHWRGVRASEVEFDDGVTIVAGPNEIGKTSLIEALRFLFRFPDSSSHRDIESVRPVHADEAPRVALDAELGDCTIHYAKRFKKTGRAGETTLRIEVPGRNPEQLTGRDAHDRAETLLANDIDVALWEALQVEQGGGVGQVDLRDRRGLQEALDAAAGTERMASEQAASLIERAAQAYAEHFTPTGKPRGAMAELPRAIGDARARRDTIQARLDQVEDAAERHEGLHRRLAEMRNRLPELEARVAEARQRLAEVQQLESAHAKKALVVKTLEQQLNEALDDDRQRARWRAQIDETGQAVAGGRERLAAVEREQRTLKDRLSAVESAQSAAQARRDEAKAQAHRYRQAIERNVLRQRLETLEARLAQVTSLDEKRLAAQAVVDAIALERADIAALRDLEHALVEARAATLAVTPRIQVTALNTVELSVRGEAVRLGKGDTHDDVASAGFALEVPGLLTVDVSTTTGIEQSRAAAATAREAFEAALSEHHVSSLAGAEQRLQEKEQARERVENLAVQRNDWLNSETLEALRGSASELAARVSAIDAELAGQSVPDEETALRNELDTTEATAAAAQQALDRGAAEATRLRVEINSIGHEVERLTAQSRAGEDAIAAASASLDAARAALGDDALAKRIDAARHELSRAQADWQGLDAALNAADPASVTLLAENSAAALTRHVEEIGKTEVELGKLDGELAQTRREGLFDQLSGVETELAGLDAEYGRVERRARAAERLWQVLDAHRAAASRRYVRPLKDRIDVLGRLVFGPTFSVDIDGDLAIENRSLNGVSVPFDSLSGGAREQLGILARLAAAQIVGQHSQVPLMMDDTLGFTDDDRLTRMGAAIAQVARDNQVIILTCMPSRFAYIGNAKTVAL
jgi:DNA repair exonuclease SbcCD ATPase subunit